MPLTPTRDPGSVPDACRVYPSRVSRLSVLMVVERQ
jgi:hypothetical protein